MTTVSDGLVHADQQHLAWLARSFGRPDYLPLSRRDLELLADSGEVVTRYPGTHLFKEGDQATAAYLVQDGNVDLYRGQNELKRVVARVSAGSVLGDIAMFSDAPYISSAKAVGHVVAFRFERDRLLPRLAQHPAICLRWLVAGLRQLEETQRRVIHLMHKTVKAQVADLLLEEGDTRDEVHLSQAAMAMLLGASRQSVNEALGELRDCGAITTGYRVVKILDRPELLTAADSDRR